MTSINMYSLMALGERVADDASKAVIQQAVDDIERLERQVDRLKTQIRDLGEEPDPGE